MSKRHCILAATLLGTLSTPALADGLKLVHEVSVETRHAKCKEEGRKGDNAIVPTVSLVEIVVGVAALHSVVGFQPPPGVVKISTAEKLAQRPAHERINDI